MESYLCALVTGQAPYEPLSVTSLLLLVCKTAFLLAFATARRRSELHALLIDPACLRFNQLDGSVSLTCEPGFLAKNQLPSVVPRTITVPSLARSCGPRDSDRLLCPVRALKFYLKRVRQMRGGAQEAIHPGEGEVRYLGSHYITRDRLYNQKGV